MNKNDIIKEYNLFINKFKLKPEEFILGAGGALLMHGLREITDDMDTAINNDLFDKLLSSKKYKLHYFGDVEVLEYNKYIDLHRLLFKPDTILINDVCCYSVKELLKQKQELNRPKDQNDIKLLQELLKKENNVSTEDISDLITIPQDILDKANTDPILSGYINKSILRVGIYFGDRVVGFYSPVEEEYKGKMYWRTGNIYVLPEYRNKGLGSKTILDFFADKENGLAHIAENNPASLKAFENAGFKNLGMLLNKNPKGKSLYLLIKESNQSDSFTKWN